MQSVRRPLLQSVMTATVWASAWGTRKHMRHQNSFMKMLPARGGADTYVNRIVRNEYRSGEKFYAYLIRIFTSRMQFLMAGALQKTATGQVPLSYLTEPLPCYRKYSCVTGKASDEENSEALLRFFSRITFSPTRQRSIRRTRWRFDQCPSCIAGHTDG